MGGVSAQLYGTTGPFVVLIHGWCCTGEVWRHQVAAFADRCRLIVFDLGHPDPTTEDVSLAASGKAIARWLDAQEIAPCILVGHSMGGPIALEAARHLGPRCRGVIGVDTFTDASFYAAVSEADISRRLEPFQRDFSGAMARMVRAITLAGGPELRDWITRMMASAPPELAIARLSALLAHDIAAVWSQVDCPISTINSAPLDRPATRLALPRLDLLLMPDVGHFPMLEAPDAFYRHLAVGCGVTI